LSVGAGIEEATECGPVINAAAVERISNLVDDAVSKGAKVVCGGQRLDQQGYYYLPTVLADVSTDTELIDTEIFGPVAPIFRFDTEEEAIRRANDTEYGLVAYVYTQSLSRGLNVSERLEAGMVAVNRGLVSDPAAPFGGVKQS